MRLASLEFKQCIWLQQAPPSMHVAFTKELVCCMMLTNPVVSTTHHRAEPEPTIEPHKLHGFGGDGHAQ
jgi:hypothetical protein